MYSSVARSTGCPPFQHPRPANRPVQEPGARESSQTTSAALAHAAAFAPSRRLGERHHRSMALLRPTPCDGATRPQVVVVRECRHGFEWCGLLQGHAVGRAGTVRQPVHSWPTEDRRRPSAAEGRAHRSSVTAAPVEAQSSSHRHAKRGLQVGSEIKTCSRRSRSARGRYF